MGFLDTTCFGSTTIGDLFKLIVPVGWTIVAFCAVLAYLLSPLSRGDGPRWGSAALVLFNCLSALGLSAAIFNFHRSTSYYSAEWTEAQIEQRKKTLDLFWIVSACFTLVSAIVLIYFAAFASHLEKCAHESCGADIGWSMVTVLLNTAWLGITFLSGKNLNAQLAGASSASSSAPAGATSNVNTQFPINQA